MLAKKNPPVKKLYKADHDPRAACLLALLAVVDAKQNSQAALEQALGSSQLVPSDKRLCTEMFYGVLRYFIRLEWFSGFFIKKAKKLPREMYMSLLLSLYCMLFLRTPHHAIVGWAVNHCKNRFGQQMGGVANGVLRAMQRKLSPFRSFSFYKENTQNEQEAKALWYSLPLELFTLWSEAYGTEECEKLCEHSLLKAPIGVRLNALLPQYEKNRKALITEYSEVEQAKNAKARRNSEEEDALQTVFYEFDSYALAFPQGLPFLAKTLIKEGAASIQSIAAYEALWRVAPSSWGERVWDACAGRGGKSFALLERGVSVTLCTEPSELRFQALKQEADRLHIKNKPAFACCSAANFFSMDRTGLDAQSTEKASISELAPYFSTIVLDVPCSGFGTLSKKPEIAFRRNKEDIQGLIASQRSLLKLAAAHLEPGGSILYISCTVNPEENEQQVEWFLGEHADFNCELVFKTDFTSPYHEFFFSARLRKAL